MDQNRRQRRLERPIRRAAAACYRCHWRKVRCDAAIHGHPCTNCALDGRTDCVLRPNSTSRFKSLQQTDRIWPSKVPATDETIPSNPAPTIDVNIPPPSAVLESNNNHYINNGDSDDTMFSTNFTFSGDLEFQNLMMPSFNIDSSELIPDSNHNLGGHIFPNQHFINLDRVRLLPMDDVHVLVVNGCLDVPSKAVVNVFVRKYFLLVHPSLPILDEAQFWDIYGQSDENPSCTPRISLLIFQEMLLASCAFVPIEIIYKCGFKDTHDARRILYNRAKVVYDTNFEDHPLPRAQGALLLTYHTTAEDPQATMTWNLCAIQNAMSEELHLSTLSIHDHQISLKKRLWWSIFVGDRTLWLGRHRCPQFYSTNFNINFDCPDATDFENEIMFSQVYTPDVKRLLVKVFQAQCHLGRILTDVISIAFSASDGFVPYFCLEEFRNTLTRIQLLKKTLARWKDDYYLPLIHFDLPEQESSNVQVHLTHIYCQTARMALAHHETLLVENHLDLIQEESGTLLLMIAKDLRDAVEQITQTMGYFGSKKLTENISLGVLAYCGTPMVLSAIDIKLSASNSDMMERRGSLEYFSEIIRQSRQIYNVTGFFSDGTNNILQLAFAITRDIFLQEDVAASQPSPHRAQNGLSSIGLIDQRGFNTGLVGGGDTNCRPLLPTFKTLRVRNWTDAFLRYPRAYLLISTCIDSSLATGRLPRDESLPPLVRDTASFLLRMPSLPWTLTPNATLNNSGTLTYSQDPRRVRGKPYQRAKYSTKPTADVTNRNVSVMDDPWYLALLQSENEQLSGFSSGMITDESANTVHDECINIQPGDDDYTLNV